MNTIKYVKDTFNTCTQGTKLDDTDDINNMYYPIFFFRVEGGHGKIIQYRKRGRIIIILTTLHY